MTPKQITELESIWQRELETRAGPWEAALACVKHALKTRKPTTKRKVLKARVTEILRIIREEYPEDAVPRVLPLLEEIERTL